MSTVTMAGVNQLITQIQAAAAKGNLQEVGGLFQQALDQTKLLLANVDLDEEMSDALDGRLALLEGLLITAQKEAARAAMQPAGGLTLTQIGAMSPSDIAARRAEVQAVLAAAGAETGLSAEDAAKPLTKALIMRMTPAQALARRDEIQTFLRGGVKPGLSGPS